jgi:hypothetical protein
MAIIILVRRSISKRASLSFILALAAAEASGSERTEDERSSAILKSIVFDFRSDDKQDVCFLISQ